jgi:hypothetical protein
VRDARGIGDIYNGAAHAQLSLFHVTAGPAIVAIEPFAVDYVKRTFSANARLVSVCPWVSGTGPRTAS